MCSGHIRRVHNAISPAQRSDMKLAIPHRETRNNAECLASLGALDPPSLRHCGAPGADPLIVLAKVGAAPHSTEAPDEANLNRTDRF